MLFTRCGRLLPSSFPAYIAYIKGKLSQPYSVSLNLRPNTARGLGKAPVQAGGRLPNLSLVVFILLLVAGVSFFPSGMLRAGELPPREHQKTNAEPQATPREKYAEELKQTLQSKYRDINVGIVANDLSLLSDSFKNSTTRELEASKLLKNRVLLCEKEIWTISVGYSKDLFSKDAMKTWSLRCIQEKIAREKELKPRREKLAADLSDATMHVRVDGATVIFDTELFSDFDARTAFLQQIGSDPLYKKLFCELEITQMKLTVRSKTMRTIPVVCN